MRLAAATGGPAVVRAVPAALAAALAVLLLLAAPVAAQNAGQGLTFLFINQERILLDSRAGQQVLEREEARRRELVAEARGIDAAFEAEERELTEQRESLSDEEFRRLADDFDERVVEARQTQDERSDALAEEFDQARRQFFASVAPILVEIMEAYNAQAIFDENSVLLADQRLNITDAVIAEIDKRLVGDDPGGSPPADEAEDEDTQP